jgi:signal transduction histidine kinase
MARDHSELIQRADELISDEELRGAGFREHADPMYREHADRGLAVGLSVLALLQMALFTALSVYPKIAATLSLQPHPGLWPYLMVLGCFLPLAVRRRWPVPVLVVTAAFAAFYSAMAWPPTFAVVGPMLALYTVATRYGGRRVVPAGVALFVMMLGVSALSVSISYTLTQAVGMLALLGLSAALGHSARTRRQLFDAISRTRKEADRRRLEEERLRIARDVHDIMAHSLTLMTVQADAGLAAFDDKPERSRDSLAVIGETGRSTLRDLRSILEVLTQGDDDSPRSPVADLSGLDGLVASVRDAGFHTSLETEGDLAAVPTAVAVSAYRIVQESLTNVVRHSNATDVSVRVCAAADALDVSVTDDGRGDAAPSPGAGHGIPGMKERVLALGGTMEAGKVSEGGFRVAAHIPFARGD